MPHDHIFIPSSIPFRLHTEPSGQRHGEFIIPVHDLIRQMAFYGCTVLFFSTGLSAAGLLTGVIHSSHSLFVPGIIASGLGVLIAAVFAGKIWTILSTQMAILVDPENSVIITRKVRVSRERSDVQRYTLAECSYRVHPVSLRVGPIWLPKWSGFACILRAGNECHVLACDSTPNTVLGCSSEQQDVLKQIMKSEGERISAFGVLRM